MIEGDDDDDDAHDEPEIVAAGLGDHAYGNDIYDADTQSWSPDDFSDIDISRINQWLQSNRQ